MATSILSPVIDRLRRAACVRDGAALTDAQLLGSFLTGSNEAAFEVLVKRHGPMVLGVARRLLRNHHDAEDAFQATFLVLARKAASIAPRHMVANWLHGVAYRTASKLRTTLARRQTRERQVDVLPDVEAADPHDSCVELRKLLDRELRLLPDKYRTAVVLCDLEGKTGKETAHQLGWPEGTVSSRLARGRTLLAKRLTRHGLALPGGILAVSLSNNASAAVPAALASSTIKAATSFAAGKTAAQGLITSQAAALTEGTLRAMTFTKLKIAAAVLLAAAILGGRLGAGAFNLNEQAPPAAPKEEARRKTDKERFQGHWHGVSCAGPVKFTDEEAAESHDFFEDDSWKVTVEGRGHYGMTFTLDETKKPKQINAMMVEPEKGPMPYLGIYTIEGDELKLCFSKPGDERPTEFTGGAKTGWTLNVLKREKPNKDDDKKPTAADRKER